MRFCKQKHSDFVSAHRSETKLPREGSSSSERYNSAVFTCYVVWGMASNHVVSYMASDRYISRGRLFRNRNRSRFIYNAYIQANRAQNMRHRWSFHSSLDMLVVNHELLTDKRSKPANWFMRECNIPLDNHSPSPMVSGSYVVDSSSCE